MKPIPIPSFPVRPSVIDIGRPRFSIITATYNSGLLFDRTAQSIRDQNFRDFEWIVVDGSSTDDTVHRINAHQKLITHWVSESDRGISDAWNKGLALAQGEYVLILNAGDTYDSDFLQQIDMYSGDGRRVICSHARLLSVKCENLGIIRSEPRKLVRAMHLAHNWCAVPRMHYEQLGGYVEMKLAMDFEWFHRYYRRHGINGFYVINTVLGSYHLGGTSDINYIESFRKNADILIHYGTHRAVANLWCLLYTVKHFLHVRLKLIFSR